MSVFESTYDADFFQQYKRFQSWEKSKIVDMCLSQKEENVIVSYANNQMAHFSLANLDIMKESDNNFTVLPIGFHGDSINGMDVCIQKTIVATASADRSLRIWNYAKSTVELYREFNEEVLCVALHPNGMHVILGFRYRLAMFNILSDDLHECGKWSVKNCKVVRFSHGGHKFAVVSANSVIVFSTYTHETAHVLKGHSNHITSLEWSDDDRFIVTCGNEGAVYEWCLEVSS